MTLIMTLLFLAGCTEPETIRVPAAAESSLEGGRQTFVIVPESTASYIVDEEFFGLALSKYGIAAGFGKAVGRTQEIEGRFELDPDNLQAPAGRNTFTIRMNTFKSDRPSRDEWIRQNGPRFDDYPLATFSAATIESTEPSLRSGKEVRFKLRGNLKVRDVTKPVTFEVTARLTGDTLTGTATARTRMSDFGIDPPSFANTLTAVDEFAMEVRFTARPQK